MFLQNESGEWAMGTRRGSLSASASDGTVAKDGGFISHAAARERALAVFAALLA